MWPVILVWVLLAGRADVVHCHSPSVAPVTRLTCWLGRRLSRRMTHVYTEHNVWDNRSRPKRLALSATGRLDGTRLACSNAVRESLPPCSGQTRRSSSTGSPVLISMAWRGRRLMHDASWRSPLTRPRPCVGVVAGFRPEKRHDLAVEVMDLVCERVPQSRFVFIGDGETRTATERRVDELGRADFARFTGQLLGAATLLRAFDVLLLTSDHEGLPVVIMEAFSLGVPVVATDAGGVGELVVDGENGRLVPCGEVEALAAAVGGLLEDVPARRRLATGASAAGRAMDAAAVADALSKRYWAAVTDQ